jgi:hypothetical protein
MPPFASRTLCLNAASSRSEGGIDVRSDQSSGCATAVTGPVREGFKIRRCNCGCTKNDDQKTGVEIVRKAFSAPARQIAINAGEDGSVVVGKILEKDQYGFGFDSQIGEYGNLVTKGIIDPTKVVRVAIQNAASVAALLITTEAMVGEVPKKNAAGGMAAGGGGMGGGMDF